jgi:hypothetical protein
MAGDLADATAAARYLKEIGRLVQDQWLADT